MAATLVFDLGGVVLNWQPAQLLQRQLPDRLHSADEAQQLAGVFFESFRPGSDWAEFDRGVLEVDEVAQRIASRTGLLHDEVLGVMHAIPEHLQLRADSAVLLRELQQAGRRLVYLSNMPQAYVEHASRQLDSLGVFERGVFSSQVGMVKPQEPIYQLALQRFETRAADCVFFDDSLANVETASRLGWRAFRFSDAAAARVALVALGLIPQEAGEAGRSRQSAVS